MGGGNSGMHGYSNGMSTSGNGFSTSHKGGMNSHAMSGAYGGNMNQPSMESEVSEERRQAPRPDSRVPERPDSRSR
jgi:hypothetical protein